MDKKHFLPNGWAPTDLVSVGKGQKLRSEAAAAYKKMDAAAEDDGVNFVLVSSYRSQSLQARLYKKNYAKDPEWAILSSAYPRSSEHELGLAVDISDKYQLYQGLEKKAVGKWLVANAHKYGWVMSYPKGKTHITGYKYEPWHYRYVGVELATHLKKNNLTLQEYYD